MILGFFPLSIWNSYYFYFLTSISFSFYSILLVPIFSVFSFLITVSFVFYSFFSDRGLMFDFFQKHFTKCCLFNQNDHRERTVTQFKKSRHFKSDVVRNSSDILKIQAHGDYLEFDLDTNVLPCDYFYRQEEYPEVKFLTLY